MVAKSKSMAQKIEKGNVRLNPIKKKSAGWWFQIFFIFIPTWGDDPIWRSYFSNRLKPRTTQRCTVTRWWCQISRSCFLVSPWFGEEKNNLTYISSKWLKAPPGFFGMRQPTHTSLLALSTVFPLVGLEVKAPQLNIELTHPKQTPTTTRTKSHAHLSHEKKVPGEICCFIGDEILPSYLGIIHKPLGIRFYFPVIFRGLFT